MLTWFSINTVPHRIFVHPGGSFKIMFSFDPIRNAKMLIIAYSAWVKEYLQKDWSGHLMTFMFNPLRGSLLEKNRQMKSEIEGVFSSLLTRVVRRPQAHDANLPFLLSAPDWPVHKADKKAMLDVIINDGLHHHGILLLPPPGRHHRLKCPIEKHFHDLQDYYVRDQLLKSIDARAFPWEDAADVTDYALKGLKTNRISYDEAMLVLPSNHPSRRPYVKGFG